jgi:hypothetical protein
MILKQYQNSIKMVYKNNTKVVLKIISKWCHRNDCTEVLPLMHRAGSTWRVSNWHNM